MDKCRKCESKAVAVRYDGSMDVLRKSCGHCGYEWQDKPADRRHEATADFLSRPAKPRVSG